MLFYEQNGKECLQFVAVGVTFDNKQQILQQLFELHMSYPNIKLSVKLIPQPQNQFDKNAIKISLKDGRSIGYVSTQYNQDMIKILPQIKDGYIKQVYLNNKRIYNALIKLEFK